jgi:hypothetical protein
MSKSPNSKPLQWLISLAIVVSIVIGTSLLWVFISFGETYAVSPAIYANGVELKPLVGEYPNSSGDYSIVSNQNVSITQVGQIDGSLTLSGGGTFTFSSPIDLTGTILILSGTLAFSGNNTIKCNSIYIGEYDKTQSNPVYTSKWEMVDGKLVDNGYYLSVTTIIKSPHIVVNLANSNIQCFAFVVRGGDTIVNPGNSSIITTLLQDDCSRTGHSYKNVTIINSQGIYGWIEGKSSFTALIIQGNAYVTDTISAGAYSNSSGWVKSAPTDLNKGTIVKVNSISLVSCK